MCGHLLIRKVMKINYSFTASFPVVLGAESNVSSPNELSRKIPLGSKPPPLTRIARIGLGTRLIGSYFKMPSSLESNLLSGRQNNSLRFFKLGWLPLICSVDLFVHAYSLLANYNS